MRLHQRIRRDQATHTDDWLITYADTITLLLCLFVIILTIRTGGKNPPREAAAVVQAAPPEVVFFGQQPFLPLTPVARAVGEEAQAEAVAPDTFGFGAGPETETPARIVAAEQTAAPPAPEQRQPAPTEERPDTARLMLPAIAARPVLAAADWQETMQPSLPAPSLPASSLPASSLPAPSLPTIVDRLKKQGTPIVAQTGERITTLQISSGAFFGSGYAALSGAGKAILHDVAATLKSGEFAAYRVSIEGHTDDTPIATAQFQSNWELSTARAAAVVRFFLEQGVPARKLTAAGYADTFPIAPNRNADGTVIPENQAKNRRVVIKLEKIASAEQ